MIMEHLLLIIGQEGWSLVKEYSGKWGANFLMLHERQIRCDSICKMLLLITYLLFLFKI